MTIIKRADLGRPLTYDELDDNFQQVDDLTAAASAAVSSASASATAAAGSAAASASSATDAANSAANAAATLVSAVKSTVTFTTGGTLNSNLDRISDGTYLYYWTGSYPVTVPAGSTVADSGGIGVGFWGIDTPVVLQTALSSDTGAQVPGYRERNVYSRLDDEVSVLDFGTAAEFGTAMNAALTYLNSKGGGTIFIPGGNYTLDTPVVTTLSGNIEIRASRRSDIVVTNLTDVFTVTAGDYCLSVFGLTVTVNLPSTDTTYAVFKFNGQTLKQSLVVDGCTLRRIGSNNIGYFVYAVAANAMEILNCHISAASVPVHLESSSLNSSTALVANAMEFEFSGNKVYNAGLAGIEIVNKGYYGCEGVVVTRNKIICSGSAISITADATLRSSYMPPLLQVSDNHFNAYRALYAEKISRVYFHNNDVQSKFRSTDTILGIFEIYSCQGISLTKNKITAVAQDGSTRDNINTPIYLGSLDTTLPNAYLEVDGNFFWLDNATTNNFVIASSTAITGRVSYGKNATQTAGAIVDSTYKYNFDISKDNILSVYDSSQGIGYISSDTRYSFASNVLTIISRGQYNDLHTISTTIVPNGSTITQIVANNTYGRRLNIQFDASELTFTHGTNMLLPDGKSCKNWLPTKLSVEMFTNTASRIWAIGGTAVRRPMLASKPTTATVGQVGDWYYDSTTGKTYDYVPGVGFRATTTVAPDAS